MEQVLPDAQKRRARDIMTTDVVTVQPDTRVSEVARLMSEHAISGLPVVDEDDRVLGVITEADMMVRNSRFKMPTFIVFLDSFISLETPAHFRKRLEHMLGNTASEIMSKPAVTIGPGATIEELSSLMIERKMNPIPVVENDHLVGIISRSDIIRLMAEDFWQRKEE